MINNKRKNRSAYWDNFKGLLIILVVIGHFLWAYKKCHIAGLLVKLIYMFHMPAFVFVSGYLSKPDKAYEVKNTLRLLVSYFIVNTMMLGYSCLILNKPISLMRPYYSCWYLIALVVWRLILPQCLKIKGAMAISIGLSLLVGFSSEIDNRLALARIITFFPFFIGGSLIAKNYKKFIHTEKKIKECLAGIIVTSFFVVIAILVIRKFDINTNDELMYAYLAPMGVDCAKRIFIMIIAFGIIVGMSMFVVDKEYPIITKCGRNSLTIYLFHRVFSLIYAEVFPNELYQEYYILIALFFSIITVMILGTNRFSDFYAKFVDKICYALIEGNRDITIRKKMILLEGIVGIIIVFAFIWPIRLKL